VSEVEGGKAYGTSRSVLWWGDMSSVSRDCVVAGALWCGDDTLLVSKSASVLALHFSCYMIPL
jgi:hypothetical protein